MRPIESIDAIYRRSPPRLRSCTATCGGPRTTDNHRRIAPAIRPSTRSRIVRSGVIAELHAGPLDQTGKYKRRCDGVAAASFAVACVLIGLHFSRVVATLRHADGRTDTVRD
jgi:hypothetical protein